MSSRTMRRAVAAIVAVCCGSSAWPSDWNYASGARQAAAAETDAAAVDADQTTLRLRVRADGKISLANGEPIPGDALISVLAPLVQTVPPPAIQVEIHGNPEGFAQFDELSLLLWDAGVREVQMTVIHSQRIPLDAPTPDLRIRHARSESERAAAVAELLNALKSDEQRGRAIIWLQKVEKEPFDRTPFLPVVREVLASPSPGLRVAAMRVLRQVGCGVEDVPTLLRMVDDHDVSVRSMLASALYSVDPQASQPGVLEAVEKLLNDSAPSVSLYTAKSLWGCPTSPDIDQLLVNMSYDPQHGGDIVYQALSTRPLVRKPVAERLIELARGKTGVGDSRALWGLTHHRLDEESRELVTPLLIDIARTSPDRNQRLDAIWGLGSHQHPTAEPVLRELNQGEQPPAIQKAAQDALKAFHGGDPPKLPGAA